MIRETVRVNHYKAPNAEDSTSDSDCNRQTSMCFRNHRRMDPSGRPSHSSLLSVLGNRTGHKSGPHRSTLRDFMASDIRRDHVLLCSIGRLRDSGDR
jgi:hypothetical protein